jgi:hypothetical protein
MLIVLHSAAVHVLYLSGATKVIDILEIVLWRWTTTDYQRTLKGETDPLWDGECFNQTRQADWYIMPMWSVSLLQTYLGFSRWLLGGSSRLGKHPGRSGNHNRMEICFHWTAQVRNLPMKVFFSIATHLDIHSSIISSEVHLHKWSKSSGCHKRTCQP